MMIHETIELNAERNVVLETYVLPCGGEFGFTERRPAVLVLPGGGYGFCSDREAEPVALAFNARGFHAFVLRYSVGEHRSWPNPLRDYEQAMGHILNHADAWHVDPDRVAVIGFSAGGHLAGAAATMSELRPNAVILGYPVTLEQAAKTMDETLPGIIDSMDADTPPAFVFASRNDALVPVENSLAFVTAMNEHHLSYELHIYAYANHGFSLATEEMVGRKTQDVCARTPAWLDDAASWLDDVFAGRVREHRTSASHDAYDEHLSVDHSLGHVLNNAEARKLVSSFTKHGPSLPVPAGFSLRKALEHAGVPADRIRALDQALRHIDNT